MNASNPASLCGVVLRRRGPEGFVDHAHKASTGAEEASADDEDLPAVGDPRRLGGSRWLRGIDGPRVRVDVISEGVVMEDTKRVDTARYVDAVAQHAACRVGAWRWHGCAETPCLRRRLVDVHSSDRPVERHHVAAN